MFDPLSCYTDRTACSGQSSPCADLVLYRQLSPYRSSLLIKVFLVSSPLGLHCCLNLTTRVSWKGDRKAAYVCAFLFHRLLTPSFTVQSMPRGRVLRSPSVLKDNRELGNITHHNFKVSFYTKLQQYSFFAIFVLEISVFPNTSVNFLSTANLTEENGDTVHR